MLLSFCSKEAPATIPVAKEKPVAVPVATAPEAPARAPAAKTKPMAKLADCSLRQGARPLEGTYKGDWFTYFLICYLLISFICYLKTMFFELLNAKPCRII